MTKDWSRQNKASGARAGVAPRDTQRIPVKVSVCRGRDSADDSIVRRVFDDDLACADSAEVAGDVAAAREKCGITQRKALNWGRANGAVRHLADATAAAIAVGSGRHGQCASSRFSSLADTARPGHEALPLRTCKQILSLARIRCPKQARDIMHHDTVNAHCSREPDSDAKGRLHRAPSGGRKARPVCPVARCGDCSDMFHQKIVLARCERVRKRRAPRPCRGLSPVRNYRPLSESTQSMHRPGRRLVTAWPLEVSVNGDGVEVCMAESIKVIQ